MARLRTTSTPRSSALLACQPPLTKTIVSYAWRVTHTLRRAAAASLSVAFIAAATAAPALAGNTDWDGQDRGHAMSITNAILVFAVIPAAISGLLAGFILVPDWFRKAKASTRGGYLDDPTLADREALETATRAELTH